MQYSHHLFFFVVIRGYLLPLFIIREFKEFREFRD